MIAKTISRIIHIHNNNCTPFSLSCLRSLSRCPHFLCLMIMGTMMIRSMTTIMTAKKILILHSFHHICLRRVEALERNMSLWLESSSDLMLRSSKRSPRSMTLLILFCMTPTTSLTWPWILDRRPSSMSLEGWAVGPFMKKSSSSPDWSSSRAVLSAPPTVSYPRLNLGGISYCSQTACYRFCLIRK